MRASKTPRNITHREYKCVAAKHEPIDTKVIEGQKDNYTHIACVDRPSIAYDTVALPHIVSSRIVTSRLFHSSHSPDQTAHNARSLKLNPSVLSTDEISHRRRCRQQRSKPHSHVDDTGRR